MEATQGVYSAQKAMKARGRGRCKGGGHEGAGGGVVREGEPVEQAHGADHGLLGDEAREEGHGGLPEAEAAGANTGAMKVPTAARMLSSVAATMWREVSKFWRNQSTTLMARMMVPRPSQEVPYPLPHVEGDVLEGGHPVGGQLQQEGGGLPP